MSFLTEYFDNYRQHPFKKTKPCQPENRYAPIEGRWLVPATGSDDGRRLYVENYVTLDLQKQWSEEDVKKFIKETMANLRGRSTYYNEYCAHLPEDLKTRPFVPRPKKQKPCPEKDPTKLAPLEPEKPLQPIDIQGSELMRTARALYDLDPDHLVLEPLATHHRS